MDPHIHREQRPPPNTEVPDYPRWDALPAPCRARLEAVLTEMVGQYLQGEEGDGRVPHGSTRN